MTAQQPEALRLADLLTDSHLPVHHKAAAELRRLHAENELLKATQYGSGRLQELRDVRDKLLAENEDFRATCDHLTRENAGQIGEIVALKGQRDELLEALQSVWLWMEDQADGQSKGGHATFDLMLLREQREIACAAIAKATGDTPCQ